jgi:hypothetical protein
VRFAAGLWSGYNSLYLSLQSNIQCFDEIMDKAFFNLVVNAPG